MRIVIVTQDEDLYLPRSLAKVVKAFPEAVVCICSMPAMSTHGGAIRGYVRHLRLFGLTGSARLGWRLLSSKLHARLRLPGRGGPFYSMAQVARAWDVPYHRVERVGGPEFGAVLDRYRPDLLISISCPQIIPRQVRDRLPLGSINVHGGPLPRYRGLMPSFWVLRNGEARTAVTVHALAAKLDDGEILLQHAVEILPGDTWDSLVRRTKEVGADLLIEAIRRIDAGTIERRPNPDSEATYFSFPTPADRRAFLAAGRRFF